MTEPTTEELVERLYETAKLRENTMSGAGWLYKLAAQRLSDLEGKLGEARKALVEANDELAIARIWMPRPPIMTTGRSTGPDTPPTSKPAESLKLTASGGGEGSSSASSERAARSPSAICDQERRELLEALKALLPEGWGDDDTMDHIQEVKRARLAIAKAERVARSETPLKPVAWRCKDYSDDWIYYRTEGAAAAYAKQTGCLIEALYSGPAECSLSGRLGNTTEGKETRDGL